jgi:aspartate-semialdehyde dehydrogenase
MKAFLAKKQRDVKKNLCRHGVISYAYGKGNKMTKKSQKTYKIAVAGATGNVGREVLQILADREFPAHDVVALASSRSTGTEVSFGEDKVLQVQDLAAYDFAGTDFVFAAVEGDIVQQLAPRATAAGSVVIDKSSAYRMDPDVPLVVPEVNADALRGFAKKRIVATPNCSTTQMVLALKPLHDAATIRRVVVATYQSVSGAGTAAMDELFRQTRAIFVNDAVETEVFTKQIAYNVIPHIDAFMDSGDTKEEFKMVAETKKILGAKIKVTATCVRVPVFIGHSEAVWVEFENELDERDARKLLQKAPGITVVDHREPGGYVTPVEVAGEDNVYISRIRQDSSVEHGLSFWCVGDNLRKGAALNAVQIAEAMVKICLLYTSPSPRDH